MKKLLTLSSLAVVGFATLSLASTTPLAARTTKTPALSRHPVLVVLGTHRFGHTRMPDAVVARAAAGEVGWQGEGDPSGPETFLVGRDRSIWLHDQVNHRLLVWRAGLPNTIARNVTLPFLNAEDVALGPANTLYFDRDVPELKQFHLYRMSLESGKLLWDSNLAPEAGNGNTWLRVGPDGTLYARAGLRWLPTATPDGRPLPVSVQQRGITDQPAGNGLRLVWRIQGTHLPTHRLVLSLLNRSGAAVRTWEIQSRTPIYYDSGLLDFRAGDPLVVLEVQKQEGAPSSPKLKWEYEILQLSPSGTSFRFSLPHAVFGDNLFADLRVSGSSLYQLASSPSTGVVIDRYSLGTMQQCGG
jgi:hypothetical protein